MIGIIFNPLCRLGHSVDRFSEFLKKMDASGLEYVCRETTGPGDATNIARELADTCDIIMPVGGDGTLHEVINGVYNRDVKIVVLPYGSGNDFTISIYGKDPSDEYILDILKNGVVKEVDIAMVNDRYILDMMLAFGVIVTIQERYLQCGGSYLRAIPKSIRKSLIRRYMVVVDGRTFFCRTELIAVMNCKTAGGGMILAKEADVSDGRLELVVMHKKSVLRRFMNLFALLGGRFNEQRNVEMIPFKECTIIPEAMTLCNLDGELIRMKDVHIKVLDKRVKFLVNKEGITNEGIYQSIKDAAKKAKTTAKKTAKKAKKAIYPQAKAIADSLHLINRAHDVSDTSDGHEERTGDVHIVH